MKSLTAIAVFGVELGILVGLCVRAYDFSFFIHPHEPGFVVPQVMVFFACYAAVGSVLWLVRRPVYGGMSVLASRRLIMHRLLVSVCMAMSVMMILDLTLWLRMGDSKEMIDVANTERVPSEFHEQWFNNRIERMQSERWIYIMLFASMCLLYGRPAVLNVEPARAVNSTCRDAC
jgi:hypothetical protein